MVREHYRIQSVPIFSGLGGTLGARRSLTGIAARIQGPSIPSLALNLVRMWPHRRLSPPNSSSSPTEASKRLRGATRGGFLSSSSVPGAGTLIKVEENCEARHGVGRGVVGVALTPLQTKPASNYWSADHAGGEGLVLGAILLMGYLGGATAAKVRVSDPLFETLFPIIVGR